MRPSSHYPPPQPPTLALLSPPNPSALPALLLSSPASSPLHLLLLVSLDYVYFSVGTFKFQGPELDSSVSSKTVSHLKWAVVVSVVLSVGECKV